MKLPRCPRCRKRLILGSQVTGRLDRFFAWFFVAPVRCQLCGHQFRAFRRRPGWAPPRLDRRTSDRIGIELPARLTGPGMKAPASVTDIALSGCRLDTPAEATVGAVFTLEIWGPAGKRPVKVDRAIVRWVRKGAMGVEFVQLSPAERPHLLSLVYEVLHGTTAKP